MKNKMNNFSHNKFLRQIGRQVTKQAFLITLAASCIFSCETKDDMQPGGGDGAGKSGYLVGKVTDQNGQGVAGATIYTANTVFKDRGAEVTSSSNGAYKIAMVEGLGQWIAKAYTLAEYNGRVYKMPLHPENSDSFTAEEKPVRNFEWRIQGHMPDKGLNLYYGGSAELYRDLNSNLYDSENVEFTFTPVGPLIDGSAGKTLKLSGGKSGSNNYNRIDDIPIGRYKVSAIYKPTGETLGVRDAWNDYDYYTTITVDFMGTENSYRANQMGIGFTDL
ncbi:carboxypeptidase-like regulatory domain-containing protein [Dyadobacter luticola]|uniref:Carboxypeptidase regulatory-like domain-containing protein n=1 Tax=Dyadobacter luticola TaxID=1979387 RepID=A0A5R9L5V1_9BACT|nr:carboxypeptidase-like regulatory domain-containing protein [Dyadobacter luticola]TLV03727.1 carboxypeptidase regulatory-like domain-containing protein [Dyadobacter luticola]